MECARSPTWCSPTRWPPSGTPLSGLTRSATPTDRQSGKQQESLVAVLPEDVHCTIGDVDKLPHASLANPVCTEALVVIALDFGAAGAPSPAPRTRIPPIAVHSDTDLQIRGAACDTDTSAPPVVGEPGVEITKTSDGFHTLTLTGRLEYNPLTADTPAGGQTHPFVEPGRCLRPLASAGVPDLHLPMHGTRPGRTIGRSPALTPMPSGSPRRPA